MTKTPPLVQAAKALVRELKPLRFAPPVTHVYNPLEYAFAAHRQYLEKYGAGPREIVMMGMNPGPWGMAQTGIPFGEIQHTRDWLRIRAKIGKPPRQHPKRPIQGFDCRRSEVSGRRIWAWARQTFQTPERFFARFFIANYCPLSFMEDSGRNRTPDKLPAAERDPLYEACDRHLRRLVEHLRPQLLIGIGAFAETRATAALQDTGIRIARLLHPSPASPLSHNWAEKASAQLAGLGIEI